MQDEMTNAVSPESSFRENQMQAYLSARTKFTLDSTAIVFLHLCDSTKITIKITKSPTHTREKL